MSSTYFISDLHLDAARPHVFDGLAAFLQRISPNSARPSSHPFPHPSEQPAKRSNEECDALYILGDLFEAWIGDDDDANLATQAAELLHNFSANGPTLYLMQGNRDFLMQKNFASRAGAILLSDPTVISLYGTPTLLLHGDSLCTDDTQYQAFRSQARQPEWQAELLSRSLEERRELAASLRTLSNEATSNKAEDIIDVSPNAVIEAAERAGVKKMIHGHTHRPGCHREAWGERWVLGDWDQHAWALQASSQDIELINFVIFQ